MSMTSTSALGWYYCQLVGISSAYGVIDAAQETSMPSSINQHPLVAAALYLSNIDFNSYYAGNGILNWLLAPTTVALAVPLARQMPQLLPLLITVLTTVILGGLFAVICAVAIAAGLGADHVVLLSLAAKSVTTP